MTATTAPGIPTKLQATATPTTISVSWDTVNGATAYDIEVDGQVITGIQDVTYTHQGLTSNTMHTYRVRSRNGSIVSQWSEELKQRTTPQIEVNPGKDNMFNFVMVVPVKPGATERTITVTYNPDELEVIDLSANTPETNLTTGPIAGTNLTVTSFSPGKIVYRVDHADQTIVNSIRFQAKTSSYAKVTYTVE